MNKLQTLLSACIAGIVVAAGQPLLEISEFGNPKPAVSESLRGDGQKISGSHWECQVQKSSGPVTTWRLRFTSDRHDDPVRLQLRFVSPLDFSPSVFWDGQKERQIEKLPLVRKNHLDAFPLAAADDGKRGRAVGFAPSTILSRFQRSLTDDGLELRTRIVADDRRVQEIDIAEYDFSPEFGWRNAVEDYYNAFPAWFSPTPGVDKRIYGVSGYLMGAHVSRPFELHSARATQIGWEWTYAPWYESGNWFPTGEGWQGETNLFWDYYKHREGKQVTREEYYDAVKREIHYGNKVAAMFYYILVKDIHESVSGKHPEATQGMSGLHSLPSNQGKTLSTFAPGSPLFDYLKKQLKQVVDHFEVSGFSFDMANCSYGFKTRSQLEYALGRSWDDDGDIYTSDAVAPIPFADYVHTLKRDGKTMGTIFNAALSDFSPFPFFHCDGAIMEGFPHANVEIVLPLRLTLGRKPFSFWHGNRRHAGINEWRVAGNPAKKAELSRGLEQYHLLKSYELGAQFMAWSTSNPFFQPHIPVVQALSEAGYHPVYAVKDAGPLWAGRFGDGTDTILTFGNPKRETVSRKVRVVNRYLGGGKYGFVPRSGKLVQRFGNGETELEITLAPKEVLALRTVQVSGPIREVTVSVAPKEISFQADGDFDFVLPNRDFDGYRLKFGMEKYFSGKCAKNVTLKQIPPFADFTGRIAAVEMMSEENAPAIEAGQGSDTQIAAETLSFYRPYIAACWERFQAVRTHAPGLLDGDLAKPDLVVTAPGKGKPGKKICLGIPADFPGFTPPADWQGPFLAMPDADTLWIGGSTPEEVRKATFVYFDMLDRYQNLHVRVNFRRPAGWGGRAKFVDGDGQKYLRMEGDPEQKNNQFYYAFCRMPSVKGGDKITFRVSCKLEKLTAGKFQIGVYEFSDPNAMKSIRFQSVDVPVASDWQTISKTITLHPNTQTTRFYFLGRGAGKGDTLLVRSLEFELPQQK